MNYVWHMAEAEEWSQDSTGAEYGYGSEGEAFGPGPYYTDGSSYGYYMGAGNGWGYSYADFMGTPTGYGKIYDY